MNPTRPAAFVVVNPSGNRSRVLISKSPFVIGRQSDSDLVLRDNRVSRQHARIVVEEGLYVIEDLGSRHGIMVNGDPVTVRQSLKSSDRVDFGFEDCYKLIFLYEDDELSRLLQQIQTGQSSVPGGANLAKLRAVVEVARTLHNSLAIEEVLSAVVDAAVTITNTERGFLLLRSGKDQPLTVKVARDQRAMPLLGTAPMVSIAELEAAVATRREFLSMTLTLADGASAVAVPLVRVRAENVDETQYLSRGEATAGVLLLEGGSPDMSAGSGELLQTLALEASTILENARLLAEERGKQRLEEELDIARRIQQDMLPQQFPMDGWFRATGCSIPSYQVGGDYFDLHRAGENVWSLVVADASGKGVGPAIFASILQGAFLAAGPEPEQMPILISKINKYICERAQGERYATLFYALLDIHGMLSWVNAGHCTPIVVKPDGRAALIEANGLPVGLIESAQYMVQHARIDPGDKIVIYSDGLTDAQNLDGQFFGSRRVRKLVQENALLDCVQLHEVLVQAAKTYTDGAFASDDITLLVVEFQPLLPV